MSDVLAPASEHSYWSLATVYRSIGQNAWPAQVHNGNALITLTSKYHYYTVQPPPSEMTTGQNRACA